MKLNIDNEGRLGSEPLTTGMSLIFIIEQHLHTEYSKACIFYILDFLCLWNMQFNGKTAM